MNDECELTSYAELAGILDMLPALVREKRRAGRLSQRAAAAQIGAAPSTVCRFESGETGVSLANVAAIVRWLGHGQ